MRIKTFDKLIILVFLLEIISLATLTVSVVYLEDRLQKNKSAILLDTLRNDFILNDIRNLNQKLQTTISQHGFLTAGFENGPVMNRDRTSLEFEWLDTEISIPVLSNVADPQSQISTFKVQYSLIKSFQYAMVFWLLFTALVLSFLPLMKKHFENKIAEEQEKIRKEREYQSAKQVAHDIRSPVTALKIAVSNIAGAEKERNLILNACDRITKIADDLLEKARSQNTFAKEVVKIDGSVKLVDAVKEILEEVHVNINYQVNLSIEGISEDFTVRVDRVQLQRALSNLINNSIEATRSIQSPEITLFLRSQNSVCTISVLDNGSGIPEDVLKELGKKALTYGKEKGNGLGIYHAKNIFEEAGGKLEIQSKINVGTLVTGSLPIQP